MPFLRRQAIPLLILALAAVTRLLWLDLRPPHFDEGVNGWFVDQIQRNGSFRYDPTNYHGPLHFYVLFLAKVLFGRNLWALRIPVVLAGLGTIALLLWRLPRFTGVAVARWSALAMALSPAFLYYQRDAIHEASLALFLVLTFLGLLGIWSGGTKQDLGCFVGGLTGMILTKETYAIHVGAALLAWPCAWLWGRIIGEDPGDPVEPRRPRTFSWQDVSWSVAIALAVVVFFYSAAFFHFEDLRGLYTTFAAWVKTGVTNKGHTKPSHYWFETMAYYEWWILAGAIAAFRFLAPGADRRWRWLSITALGTLTAYAIIKYKTPWCMLALGWPFLILAALLVEEGRRTLPSRVGRVSTVVLAVILLSHGAWRGAILTWREYTNDNEPYAYVQTFESLAHFSGPILELARRDPRNRHLRGYIVGASSYPVPWLLGDFTRVGYYASGKDGKVPAIPEDRPDFVLTNEARLPAIEARLDEPYFKERIAVHPAYDKAYSLLRMSIFEEVMVGRLPEFLGEKGAGAGKPAESNPTDDDDDEEEKP